MKKLLNTLYVLTPDSYLFCRNENICVRIGDMEKLSVPALNIDSIVCFGKMTVSTPLLECELKYRTLHDLMQLPCHPPHAGVRIEI